MPSMEAFGIMADPNVVSAALALLVSVNFGIASHVQHIALDHMDARSGTVVNIGTTVVLLALLSPLYLKPATLLSESAMYFAMVGILVPAVSISFSTFSVRMIGPGLTTGIASTSPVFAMLLAVLVLGEMVTGRILSGTFVVIAGIALIALRSVRHGVSWPLWALGLPLVAAGVRGISHVVIKLGLTGLPSPMTAALIGSSVSLLVLGIVYKGSGRTLPAMNRGYYWFALGGLMNGFGLVVLNLALEMGEVVIVSPLVATTPAFTLLTGYLFFRREVIPWSSVFAILLIFCGCFLIITR